MCYTRRKQRLLEGRSGEGRAARRGEAEDPGAGQGGPEH